METKFGFYTFLLKSDFVLETGSWITDNGHILSPLRKPDNVEKNENTAQLWKFVLL